jgi:hypothetical protein
MEGHISEVAKKKRTFKILKALKQDKIYIFAKTEASVCHSPACRPKERRLFFQRCDGRSGSRDNPQGFPNRFRETQRFLPKRNLVGGFNPSAKYYSVGIFVPNIWKNIKCSKPPTRNN